VERAGDPRARNERPKCEEPVCARRDETVPTCVGIWGGQPRSDRDIRDASRAGNPFPLQRMARI